MKRSRFTETQILSMMEEAEAGMAIKDVCRKNGISLPTHTNGKAFMLIPKAPFQKESVRAVSSIPEHGWNTLRLASPVHE